MKTNRIYAEDTVKITDYRKAPAQYFGDRPVAVLNNNKAVGYAVGAELFERMMKLIERHDKTVVSEFRPNSARLKAIAQQGNEILGKATDDQLGDFSE